MKKNRQWLLRHRPAGDIGAADLELSETEIRPLAEGEVLCRNIYLSLDPTNRIWMSDRDQYMPPVQIGQVMRGGTIGIVEASRSDRIRVGEIVKPMASGWEDYTIAADSMMRPQKQTPGLPLTAQMSVLGGTGITAYFGILDIGRPQPGETVVVSAAAGAVGSIASQIAKIKGARVIGIAGSKAKCDWLVDGLKLDGAIDYRTEDVGGALGRLCPNGIDVDFENVGGTIMNEVISRMNNFGRVALCGLISAYNKEGPIAGPEDFGRVLMRRLLVKGFIVLDYFPRAGEALDQLAIWVRDGQLQWKAHVIDGLENAPDAVRLLFSGGNDGKLLVRVSPDP